MRHPDNILDENLSADDQEIVKPDRFLWTVLFRPQVAWPWIIHHSNNRIPFYLLLLLSLLTASNQFVGSFISNQNGRFFEVFLSRVTLGPVASIILYVFFAWIMSLVNRLFSGKGPAATFRKILAWGALPLFFLSALMLILRLIAIQFASSPAFQSIGARTLGIAVIAVALGFSFWAFSRVVGGVQYAQQKGTGRAIATILTSGLMLLAALFIIGVTFIGVFGFFGGLAKGFFDY